MSNKKLLEVSKTYFKEDVLYPGGLHRVPQNSWKLTQWVTRYTNLKSSAKLVSIQIASCYNPTIGYSYPSYDSLMRETGLGYGTISRSIQAMKLSGEWLVLNTAYSDNSRNTNNRYFYLSPKADDFDGPEVIGDTSWHPKLQFQNIVEYNTHLSAIKYDWLRIK